MTEETASKILKCGLAGPMIEIALMDGELEEAKESYHITMSGCVWCMDEQECEQKLCGMRG